MGVLVRLMLGHPSRLLRVARGLVLGLLGVVGLVPVAVRHQVAERVQEAGRLGVLDAIAQDDLDRMIQAGGLGVGPLVRTTGCIAGLAGDARSLVARLLPLGIGRGTRGGLRRRIVGRVALGWLALLGVRFVRARLLRWLRAGFLRRLSGGGVVRRPLVRILGRPLVLGGPLVLCRPFVLRPLVVRSPLVLRPLVLRAAFGGTARVVLGQVRLRAGRPEGAGASRR